MFIFVRRRTENTNAICEKTAGLRSGNFSNLNSACSKMLVTVKIFQFHDMLNESERYLVTANGLITIFVKYSQFRSDSFALEKGRNAVLELQKYLHFLMKDPQNPPFLSMTVEINQEELYYNCYTLRKNFNIEVPISGKILRTHLPSNFRCFATSRKVRCE